MLISSDFLEDTCKNTIETILVCLEQATKGTIYRIGPMPKLKAVRITSGIRDTESGQLTWGLPEVSDYNPPGKSWEQYRDRPGQVLEAMGWCVERHKSWTADNPYEDIRSVRRQLFGEVEDYYHLEPVLVRKVDLYGEQLSGLEYPADWQGNPIWQGSDYVVVAVIKIHFLPQTIQRGDRSTKIIKKLSRTLGTELLSLHVREIYLKAQEKLFQQRLQTCNEMAHELRNTFTKMGFVFSAIDAVMSFLREQWELELRKAFPLLEDKGTILARLSELLLLGQPQLDAQQELVQLSTGLLAEQEELTNLFLLPQQAAEWLRCKIYQKWDRLLTTSQAWKTHNEEVHDLLRRLEKSIWVVVDEDLAQKMDHLPEDLRVMWPKIAYTVFSAKNLSFLNEILRLLEHPALNMRQKQPIKKAMISLKALVEIVSTAEERANRLLVSLKTGGHLEEV